MKRMTLPEGQKKFVDSYLESVAGIKEVEPEPFFYTRLSGRMQAQEVWQLPLRPAWIITGLLLLLAINGFIAFSPAKKDGQDVVVNQVSLQNFASAYDLTVQSNY